MMNNAPIFVEVEWQSRMKQRQGVCGDSIIAGKYPQQQRNIVVLSDGLGSGVKASILSRMTATMAEKFIASEIELPKALGVMMDALPVCQERKISYATYTIIDSILNGETRVVEMGNPSFIFLRDGLEVECDTQEIRFEEWQNRSIKISRFKTRPGDRIIMFSDGITQAGLGSEKLKLGWRRNGCLDFVKNQLSGNPDLSARVLANRVVKQALRYEPGHMPHDDMSCAVVYYRRPRKLMIMTGPPFRETQDSYWASKFRQYQGSKIICGGTTSNILSRELKLNIKTELRSKAGLPATSTMKGADLVTEGILTLTRVCSLLETGEEDGSPASAIIDLIKNHDIIDFCVGTKINEAHQDPTLPADLDIRRNIIKKMAYLLENKYLKDVRIEYI